MYVGFLRRRERFCFFLVRWRDYLVGGWGWRRGYGIRVIKRFRVVGIIRDLFRVDWWRVGRSRVRGFGG